MTAIVLHAYLSASVLAAILVVLGILLTGGLHLDGLMDACDGLFCTRSPEDRLAIVRDSHVGAFGVLGAGSLLLLKYGALFALADTPSMLVAGLLLAPILGRWAMVIATVCFPYARTGETLGSTFRRAAGPVQLLLASLIGLLLVGVIIILSGLSLRTSVATLVSAIILMCGLAGFALSRISGLTGDVYGVINEGVEAAVLITLTVRWTT